MGRFVTSCLSDPLRQNAILPIDGSGPTMTPLEMGKTLFKTLRMTPKFRAMSPRVISKIAGDLALAGKLSPAIAAKADLARIGHCDATESILHWDANPTPEFDTETPFNYDRALAAGDARLKCGDNAVF